MYSEFDHKYRYIIFYLPLLTILHFMDPKQDRLRMFAVPFRIPS